ncbi:MAG: DOPA 4,5-dioxygenase family protein [bacterium]
MTDPAIESYHAHIYYDDATRPAAAEIREELARRFTVKLGRWRDEPVGPHPEPMYQVAFALEVFDSLVPWLMLHRRSLTVLVHPNTGDDLADHRDNPLWMGRILPLNLDMLK